MAPDGSYYTPMDQQYHADFQRTDKRSGNIEEPIFPIHLIGQTVPEVDPSGRIRHIVEGVDAAFKGGAGNIQLVMQVPGQVQAIGGGPKAYGEEVREAIREIQRASGGKITGIELPTQISNLSGFTPQGFSEEQRKVALDEVRDSIKFAGDIAGGGAVNIVSFEFPRNYSEADWFGKEKDAKGNQLFKQREEEKAILVDKETGKIIPIDKKETFYLYYDPKTLEVDTKEPHEFTWDQLKKLAESKDKLPEVFWVENHFENQKKRLLGEEGHYGELLQHTQQQLEDAREKPERYSKEHISALEKRKIGFEESLRALQIQEKELEKSQVKYQPVKEYAVERSAASYAEAGIWAMQESQKNIHVQRGKGELHVGPEIGWPTYYGSHPREFVELIEESRKKMVERLTSPVVEDPISHQKVKNAYYDSSINEKQAEELAKRHIKGELDTSHVGMWFQTFKTDQPWDKRVKEFKSWYKEQIEYLAEENKKKDIIGQIQVVDSASGAHGHLPAGQGILGKDIFDYMKILKEKGGYKGEFTSEGHEEEKMGQGRILTQAWQAFNSPISTGYMYGRPSPQFVDVRHSYAQIAYGTTGIFQSYVPSNDFTLWSNVPLE
jgi:hypothetical protein